MIIYLFTSAIIAFLNSAQNRFISRIFFLNSQINMLLCSLTSAGIALFVVNTLPVQIRSVYVNKLCFLWQTTRPGQIFHHEDIEQFIAVLDSNTSTGHSTAIQRGCLTQQRRNRHLQKLLYLLTLN